MNLPSPPVFTAQDNPDTDPEFLGLLNQAFEILHNGLTTVPDSSTIKDLPFSTPASGNADVEVKNPLTTKPAHVIVTNVARKDRTAITSAFSYTWALKGDLIVVSFAGLTASKKYTFTAKVE